MASTADRTGERTAATAAKTGATVDSDHGCNERGHQDSA
jgi:hypothetical protein